MGIEDVVIPTHDDLARMDGIPAEEMAPAPVVVTPPAKPEAKPELKPLVKPAAQPQEPLSAIAAELAGCQRCKLGRDRTHLVFGVGNPDADLMFIGEGPGEEEDKRGEPFVGKAGQLLTKIIEAMGLTRENVYIANIVKCRPPQNRTPMIDEVETCYPFLRRQIAAVNPKIIVALGSPASQALLSVSIPISRLRGNFYKFGERQVMPTFHPAYLLRNPSEKRAVWDDMKKVMAALGLKAPAGE